MSENASAQPEDIAVSIAEQIATEVTGSTHGASGNPLDEDTGIEITYETNDPHNFDEFIAEVVEQIEDCIGVTPDKKLQRNFIGRNASVRLLIPCTISQLKTLKNKYNN